VYNYSAGDAYRIDWVVAGSGVNDSLPGETLSVPRSTEGTRVKCWLDSTWDPVDFYSIRLNAGENLLVAYSYEDSFIHNPWQVVRNSADFNPDATLYPPGELIATGPVATSEGPGSPRLLGEAATTGVYTLRLNAPTGVGAPALRASVYPRLKSSLRRWPSSSKPQFKRKRGVAKILLTAQKGTSLGVLSGHPLHLQRSKNGKSGWKTIARLTTDANGYAIYRATARKPGVSYYRWVAPDTAGSSGSKSRTQRVTVR